LRSEKPLGPALASEIGAMFHASLEANGLSGDIAIRSREPFALDPLQGMGGRSASLEV
jgi:hypothetical protein